MKKHIFLRHFIFIIICLLFIENELYSQQDQLKNFDCAITQSQFLNSLNTIYRSKKSRKIEKKFIKRLEDIDSEFAKEFARAQFFEDKRNALNQFINVVGVGLDLSLSENKPIVNYLNQFDWSPPTAEDHDESFMIYQKLREHYKDTLNVYHYALSKQSNIEIYGIDQVEMMKEISCILKDIRDEHGTHPIAVTFYEEEKLQSYENNDIEVTTRGNEKKLLKLHIR